MKAWLVIATKENYLIWTRDGWHFDFDTMQIYNIRVCLKQSVNQSTVNESVDKQVKAASVNFWPGGGKTLQNNLKSTM